MAVFQITRFRVRRGTRAEALAAIHEFASYARSQLPDSRWTTFATPEDPRSFVSLVHADDDRAVRQYRDSLGAKHFVAKLYPLLDAPPEVSDFELVADSGSQGARERV